MVLVIDYFFWLCPVLPDSDASGADRFRRFWRPLALTGLIDCKYSPSFIQSTVGSRMKECDEAKLGRQSRWAHGATPSVS